MTASTGTVSTLPPIQRVSTQRFLQIVWVVLLVFYVVQLPIRIPEFLQNCGCPAETVASWEEMGIASTMRASFTVASTVQMIAFYGIGALLIFRRPHDRAAVFFAFTFLFLGHTFPARGAIDGQGWQNFEDFNSTAVTVAFVSILFLFPDLQFVPRWGAIVYGVLVALPFGRFLPDDHPLAMLSAAMYAPTIVIGIGFSIYRYVRLQSPVRRQQLKAFLFVMILILILIVGVTGLQAASSVPRDQALLQAFADFSAPILVAFMAISIAVSLFRYRLFEIDLVINRSLVYGAIMLFALVDFFVVAVVLQIIVGSTNPIVAAVIALVLLVLIYSRLRKFVRHFVDTRLYGFAFDLDQIRGGQPKPEIKNPGALTGKTLGAFEVLGVIGRGGMGEVYKGFDGTRTAAIKILHPDLASQSDFRRRFQREAETLMEMNHAHIVKVYTVGESDGVHYMAMEYIDGMELADYMKQSGKLSVETLRPLMNQFADALDYAHARGLVHRDIKPSNVMLRGENELVLMDFGLVKLNDSETRLTGSGAFGTIDYMAPEQILAASEVDHRADIYAVGVMLYEMLTGVRPYQGGAGQVLFAHLQQPIPDPRQLLPELPQSVARAVMQALAKNPNERHTSVGQLAAAL